MVMPFLRPEESGGIQALEQGAWKGTFMAMVEYALRADTMAFCCCIESAAHGILAVGNRCHRRRFILADAEMLWTGR